LHANKTFMSKTSEITFQVTLDDKNIPEKIQWKATDLGEAKLNDCKSIMLSIWDHQENNTMRFDLWTKDMRVDEMDQHFFQTMMTMADSYQRATGYNFINDEMKKFCNALAQKINEAEKSKKPQ
jgi:gliding motility-associated protein GldC